MNLSLILPKKYYSLHHLQFQYVKEDKYMYLFDQQQTPFYYTTPILKVFKNIHEFHNDYYVVLHLDNEDDANHEIYNFKERLDRIYGKAQNEVKKNYKEIFPNLKGYIDHVTYETCIKRPFTGSRNQLLKIKIPEENENLFHKLENVIEGQYLQCTMVYKGLKKISGGRMLEEYILIDFLTEDEWAQGETKKMMSPYGTKYNVKIVKEEESVEVPIIEETIQENVIVEENQEIQNEKIQEEIQKEEVKLKVEDMEENIEVISIQENWDQEKEIQKEEERKEEKKENHEKSKEKKKKEKNEEKKEKKHKIKKNRHEWIESKKGQLPLSDDEKDDLSDNEDFHQMTQEDKEKFRRIYKKINK